MAKKMQAAKTLGAAGGYVSSAVQKGKSAKSGKAKASRNGLTEKKLSSAGRKLSKHYHKLVGY